MPRINQQAVAGATQFDGTPGQGSWRFDDYRGIPRTTSIAVDFAAYMDEGGGQALLVTFYAERPGASPIERVILGRTDDASSVNPQNSQHEAKFCGVIVPRDDDGTFWNVICITTGKDQDGVASLQWHLCPQPESVPGDSP